VRAVFYDTWAFLALADSRDGAHAEAVTADRWLERSGFVAVTSDQVFGETLTAVHAAVGSAAAITLMDTIVAGVEGGTLTLVELNRERRDASVATFRRLAPREPRLSFTDCTSFAVMRELGIRHAFTADAHFRAAGSAIRPLFVRRAGKVVYEPPA